MRMAAAVCLSLALVAAAVPACNFHVDDYTVTPAPRPTCDGGCASCNAVSNQQASADCLCGASDAGSCDGGASSALFAAVEACAQQHCVTECLALATGSTAPSAVTDCSTCTQSKCPNETKACTADVVGCPR
jgi:hypothetical protein